MTTEPVSAGALQPVPARLTNVSPAGSESRTVAAAVVGVLPALRITIVHAASWPTTNGPTWRLSITRSGNPDTAVGSLSRSLAAS